MTRKIKPMYFAALFATGVLSAIFSSATADTYRDEYDTSWRPQKKIDYTDYNDWKSNGRFYFGLAGTNTNLATGGSISNDEITEGSSRGYSLSAGYVFSKNVAFEVALNDFGEVNKTDQFGSNIELRANSLDLAVIGRLPIAPNWVAYGKLGFSNWKAEVDLQKTPVTPNNFYRDSDSGVSLFYGVGVQHGLTRYVDLFTELQYRDMEATHFGNENYTDLATFTIGFKYSFGDSKDSKSPLSRYR